MRWTRSVPANFKLNLGSEPPGGMQPRGGEQQKSTRKSPTAKLGQRAPPPFYRSPGNMEPAWCFSVAPHRWRRCPASQTWRRTEVWTTGQQITAANTRPPASLPICRGYDIVHVWRRGVSGAAACLTQAVGPCLAEYEPVSNVELGQQTVLYYLVHVIPGGTPQAAAEHCSIQARVLQTDRRQLSETQTEICPFHVERDSEFRFAMVTHLVSRWGKDLGFTEFAGERSIDPFFHVVLKCWLTVGRRFIYSWTQSRSK